VRCVRRPLKSRQSWWATSLAASLARRRVRPNTISLAGVAFAAIGGGCLALTGLDGSMPRPILLLAAAAMIQLRLVCNLLDGMVAIEGGLKTKSGELYNDVPDRISDPLFLVGAGYGVLWGGVGPTLGWLAACLAILTAYARVLGVSVGTEAYFLGPMAKQHRMAALTVACIVGIAEAVLLQPYAGHAIGIALVAIILGSAVTVGRRLGRIAADLERR
jgi:phosphatidylglycerophosphate synthase